LKAAMIYPFFILIVVLLVLSVMMIMIVPKLLDIFEEKSTLPLSTKILINISDIFMGYWFLFIVIFGIIAIFISIWKKTPD
jgi:type IV pilus assembly protein PilC